MAGKLKKLKERLFKKYRLIILDDYLLNQTYQKNFKVYQVYILVFIPFLIILILLYLLIFGNPFSAPKSFEITQKEQKGYKRKMLQLTNEIKALEEKQKANDLYIQNLRNMMSPDVEKVKLDTAIRQAVISTQVSQDELLPTKADSILREQVAKDESQSYGFVNLQESQFDGLLFSPLKGVITANYNINENHLAVDIAAKEGEPIKAAEEGTVIFTDFTTETGYVIIIRHNGNLITVYKHNSLVYKEIGDFVEKGEVIAAVGNTGELTTGPHLHFEVWLDGKQVDPETYVDF